MNLSNRKRSAFTLIELLVVIAIIGILAAALFPAVSGAILRAQAAAFSNRGRNIVMTIIGANLERERDMLGALWPQNIASDGDHAYPRVAYATSPQDWFRNMLEIRESTGLPRIEGISPADLAGGGVVAASSPNDIGAGNVAWGLVFNMLDTDGENALFMISRNYSGLALTPHEDRYMAIDENSIGRDTADPQRSPFGDKMIVYVRKGGSAVSMRPNLLIELVVEEGRVDTVMPPTALNANAELLFPN